MMSSKNKVSKLKDKINRCQDETLLLQEKAKWGWSEKSKIMDLGTKKPCNLIQISKSEKDLEDLKETLKCMEEYESELIEGLDKSQISHAEYKKNKDSLLQNIERDIDELEKILFDESGVNKLHKRRVEMENRLKNLDVFCAAIYSTLE